MSVINGTRNLQRLMVSCQKSGLFQQVSRLSSIQLVQNHQRIHNERAKIDLQRNSNFQPKRSFYGWFVHIFNKVDTARIEEVGPDRACAEWLLRTGAKVRWVGTSANKILENYNDLPVGDFRRYKIEEAICDGASVNETGFAHFEKCQHLKRVVLKDCQYIHDDSLHFLVKVKWENLEELEINRCHGITDKGLEKLRFMKRLKKLKLVELGGVKDPEKCLEELSEALKKNTEVTYTRDLPIPD